METGLIIFQIRKILEFWSLLSREFQVFNSYFEINV